MEPTPENRPGATSRRGFLKLTAMAAAAAGLPAPAWIGRAQAETGSRGNSMPGRIVLYHDDAMGGHLSTIDAERVERVVHAGICGLTGIADVGSAFESLFPGVHAGSTFALKVNCIGPTDTRWEVARGVVSGLSRMLGGTYDVSRVTVYDRHNLGGHGYTAQRFTFNGHTAVLSSTSNPGSYYVYSSYRLSNYLVNSDYVINIPALKSHNVSQNQITVALKNHYGSCTPSSLCGDITGMLTVNADAYVKSKTGLVVTSALRATFEGDPGVSPQIWSTFTNGTPNMIFFTTDPVTNEYWAREIINTERVARGYAVKPCPWIEQAAAAPYALGVCDPGQMVVLDASGVSEEEPGRGALYLAPAAPNPFSARTTFRFHLGQAGPATLEIVDATGRRVRRTVREVPAGSSQIEWNGVDDQGHPAPAGVYFARLVGGGGVRVRRVVLTR